jgi:hypothetical protein
LLLGERRRVDFGEIEALEADVAHAGSAAVFSATIPSFCRFTNAQINSPYVSVKAFSVIPSASRASRSGRPKDQRAMMTWHGKAPSKALTSALAQASNSR